MQDISRRVALGGAAGTAALVALGAETTAAHAAAAEVPVVRAHYAAFVGKAFAATHGGRTHHVTLTAIRDAVPARAKDRQNAFTLVFTPARGTHLSEGIYRLTRRGARTHSLYLSSIGTTGGLQAVVNRTHG